MVDFHRINHIRHVIETDLDTRTMSEVESQAKIPDGKWLAEMLAILRLPVAAWDCPTTAAGEIDTEKRKTDMSWNNGQGNGNGYGQQGGYGQGYGGGDVYDRLNNTKPVGGARFPFIEEGRHKLALVTLEEFQHSSDGPSARGLFQVLESNKHAPGSYVVKIWKLVKPGKFPNQPTDADKFADFCRKLKNAPETHPIGPDIRVLMKERTREQLARGTVIECTGVPNKKGNWVETYWNAVQQSPADIAQRRAQIEAQGVPSTGNDAPQMPQQNQYQGAPHPSQMQQQYPQGQYVPMTQAGPAYAQQPMQSPVPMQQAPVAAPQGQGGFLAQLPPQGNGTPGQGNGGGW